MKRFFSIAAAFVLASACMCFSCGADPLDDFMSSLGKYKGIQFQKYEDHIEIIGCDAEVEDLEIPEKILGKPVTKVREKAFYFAKFKKAVIPGSIKNVASESFCNCRYLEELTLSEGIELLDVSAFESCTKLSSVTIPESVRAIKINVFKNCSSLSNVNFPEHVDILGAAFEGTPFYDNQAEIKYAGNWMIGCDSNVSYVTFKPGTRGITSRTFKDNKLLKSVSIPEGVIRIGSHVFEGCENLEAVDLPDSLISMGNEAFTGTPLIENQTGVLYVDGWVVDYCDNTLTSVNIKEGTRGIAAFSFWFSSIEELTLPQSLKFICEQSFLSCENLKSVTIPSGVSVIGINVFNQCYGLERIVIMNPDCEIYDTDSTFGKLSDDNTKSCDYTLYSYKNSSAQAYAEKYNRRFFAINNYGVIGDSNGDKKVSAADASAIFSEYKRNYRGEASKFTSQQIKVCDFNEDGKVTAFDASYAFSAYKKAYMANGEY